MATSVTLKPNAIDISGSTSGTTTLQASAVAGTTTLTLPAATDTLVGKATTDTLTNKTLTGAAMNGTLGATTPSTASVTTLTTSSTVTHSGGTANGVAYLDGSKVLTTGSALVFDGTNLGLGVTPSAWGSGWKATQVGSFAAVGDSGTGNVDLSNNRYNNSGDKYIGTGYATMYRQVNDGSGHKWFVAPSGTAGNAITFTQAMTLDASGNLGTNGQTSPGTFQNAGITIGTGNTNYGVNIYSSSSALGDICFAKASSGSGLYNGMLRYSHASDAMSFWTTSTERARIDSSGNLLVGTTSGFSARLSVKDSTSNGTTNAIYCKNSSDTILFYISSNGYFVTGAGANSPYNLTTASASNVTIESDGVLKRSTSSLKYKTDVQDATHGLAKVLSLRSVTYKGKNDGDTVFGGLIAEEVHAAGLTEFVQYAQDGTPDALAYGNMVSLCIKAIQEQNQLITSLTERISALEAK